HGYSNLRFKASVRQKSFEPAADVRVLASLMEYDVPVEHRAIVRAEITRPDGGTTTLVLTEQEAGYFAAGFTADQIGLYTIRVRATGTTFYGTPFQREQTLTAITAIGGDRDPGQDGVLNWLKDHDRRLCRLLECLVKEGLRDPHLLKWAREAGMNMEVIGLCLGAYCRRTDYLPIE